MFPEMTLTGFSLNASIVAEEVGHSESRATFSGIAKMNGVGIIAGMVLSDENKVSNSAVAFSRHGEELARYTKIHPFSFAGEDRFYLAGDRLSCVNYGELTFGLSICYDLRFPELFSLLANNSDVLVNIANWPAKRLHHWRTLLQARAIENQAYVVGINRVGEDGNGLRYVRSSYLIDPDGVVMAPLHSEGEIDIFDVSKERLASYREGFPTRRDRRPDLYRILQ
jgi:predicted amidohydrolase